MRSLRAIAGACVLSLALALLGCGQADGNASLTVASVPTAEVFVDGVSQGTSGSTLSLPAGEHKLEFRAEGFKSFETTVTLIAGETTPVEASLQPLDPSSPTVVARLMEAEGLEVAPWVAPEATRGRSGKQAVAVLLWPSRDVREEGLVNFAIEADETYESDASLEFRSGRKVLYREKFTPATITTIRPIPAEVLEHIKVSSKITWGLYFDDRRRPIKTSFKIVRRPNAEKQIQRLRSSRHMQRQPLITRKIAEAVVLENNRLYSEALVANLTIATEHEGSTQPFRGIITTLRRLEAENSELFATIAPHVSGKGARGIVSRGSGLAISAWSPAQTGAIPTPTVAEASGATKRMGPGGAGLVPAGGSGSTQESADPATAPESAGQAPTATGPASRPEAGTTDGLAAEVERLSGEAEAAKRELADAEEALRVSETAATEARMQAERAEADAELARQAFEAAEEPTREQAEAMAQAGAKAEEARERAAEAADDTAQAMRRMVELRDRVTTLEVQVGKIQKRLGSSRMDPAASMPSPEARPEPDVKQKPQQPSLQRSEAQKAFDQAAARVVAAEEAVAAARAAHDADPTEASQAALRAAIEGHLQAKAARDAARKVVELIDAGGSALKRPAPGKIK